MLVERLLVEECVERTWSSGNLGDDLWEWMRYTVQAPRECDWCDCPIADAVWEGDAA